MNRKLLVTLLQKNIQELELITQGFMEMTEFPMAIILLAQRKTEDIQLYINELSVSKDNMVVAAENESIQLEQEIIQIEAIEVADEIVLQEFEEISEIDEFSEVADIEKVDANNSFELAVDDTELESVIIEIPQSAPEVTVIEEEIVVEEILVAEVVIKTEEITDQNNDPVLDETPQPAVIISEETRKTILGERTTLTTYTRNELLSRADNSISSTLANKKITDIKQAINIGDRFRFQRELFRSNGEDMNKTLTYINQLATLDEVMSFLKSKYGWTTDNDASEDFYQIVRRRFL